MTTPPPDSVEKIVSEYREKMAEIGMRSDWQIGDEWLRHQLLALKQQTREERDDKQNQQFLDYVRLILKAPEINHKTLHDYRRRTGSQIVASATFMIAQKAIEAALNPPSMKEI